MASNQTKRFCWLQSAGECSRRPQEPRQAPLASSIRAGSPGFAPLTIRPNPLGGEGLGSHRVGLCPLQGRFVAAWGLRLGFPELQAQAGRPGDCSFPTLGLQPRKPAVEAKTLPSPPLRTTPSSSPTSVKFVEGFCSTIVNWSGDLRVLSK